MQTLPKEVEQLFHYLQNGTSAFHVIAHTKQVLTEAGFTELHIKDNWTLTKGGRYFCSPFDTTLYAFTIGESCDLSNGIHIAGAHTDFPASTDHYPLPEKLSQRVTDMIVRSAILWI